MWDKDEPPKTRPEQINQKTRKAELNKQRQAKTRDLKFQHRTGFNKFCNRVYINQSTPQPNEPHRAGPRQNKRITQQFKQYDLRWLRSKICPQQKSCEGSESKKTKTK